MKAHEQILKMIEEASPDDTAKLDEIDARVSAYLLKREFIKQYNTFPHNRYYNYVGFDGFDAIGIDMQYYTRSRDALKAIRPKVSGGWFHWKIRSYDDCAYASVERSSDMGTRNTPRLPTEELAELHAIIQAIAYERSE